MKKIITHSGVFHADEVFAIALLFEIRGKVPLVRTRTITDEDLNNPDIWVLDVGKQLDPVLHNFDHHQDSILSATNCQILQWLLNNKYIKLDLYDELLPMFTEISDIDRGGYEGKDGFQVNQLIKSFNYLKEIDGLDLALACATGYIKACISTVNEKTKSLEIWTKGKNYPGCSFIKCTKGFPVYWKRYNTHQFLLEDSTGNDIYNPEYKLHSIDSSKHPIIPTGKETFIHQAKFLAIYSSYEDASEACDLLLNKYKKEFWNFFKTPINKLQI